MTLAPGTTRGSTVIIPSTSVQIWISSAGRRAPTIDALKSEPPRPSVVETPFRVAPMKPETTGTAPFSTMGSTISRTRAPVSSMRGCARPKLSSVTTTRRASSAVAGVPAASRAAATISQDARSPIPEMASSVRGVSSSRFETPVYSERSSVTRPSRCARSGSWTRPATSAVIVAWWRDSTS